jgi:hypothetical protein
MPDQPQAHCGEEESGVRNSVAESQITSLRIDDSEGFLLWPTIVAIGTLFLTGWLGSYSGLFVFPFLIAAPFIAFLTLISAVINVRRKRLRKAASLLMLPLIVSLVVMMPRLIFSPFARLGDYLHLMINMHSYELELAKLPAEKGQRFRIFDWGGFAGSNTFLVYDERDLVAIAPQAEWGFVGCVQITGHYYRCDD